MKKLFVSFAALAMIIPALAQNNARTIISLTPGLPSVKDMMEDFKEQHTPYGGYNSPGGNPLVAFADRHKDAEDRIRELPKEYASDVSSFGKMDESSAKASAMGRLSGMGLSASDIAKMQSGNLSEAEQMALANKVMKAQGGMTSGDLAKLGKIMEDAQNSGSREQVEEAAKQLSAIQSRSSSYKSACSSGLLKMQEMDRTILDCLKEGGNRKEAARQKGYDLYEKKYRSQVKEIENGLHQAIMDGAFEEIPALGTEERCAAAAKRYEALTKQKFAIECKFYEEYLPVWRSAIAGTMEYYKTDVMKLSQEREAFRKEMFSQTGDSAFMAPAFTPQAVAQEYFNLSMDILDYELNLPDDQISME